MFFCYIKKSVLDNSGWLCTTEDEVCKSWRESTLENLVKMKLYVQIGTMGLEIRRVWNCYGKRKMLLKRWEEQSCTWEMEKLGV